MSERISFHAASWAQVLTLLVVTFGYFYTVVPAFQKARLEEEVARLNEEKDAFVDEATLARADLEQVRQQTEELLNNQRALESKNVELRERIASKEREIGQLKTRAEELEKSVALAQNRAKESQERMGQLKNQANEYAWRIFGEYFSLQVQVPRLRSSGIMANTVGEELNVSTLQSALDMATKQPYSVAMKLLDKIRSSENVPIEGLSPEQMEAFTNRTDKILRVNREILTCPKVDKEEWISAFKAQSDQLDMFSDSCVEAEWKEIIEERGWSEEEVETLKESDYWDKQDKIFQRSCDMRHRHRLERRFTTAILDIKKACGMRSSSIYTLLGEGDPGVESFPSVQPPSPEQSEKSMDSG